MGATIYEVLGIPQTAVWYEEEFAEARADLQAIYCVNLIPGLT